MCSCLLAHAHACKLMLMNQHACPPGKDDEMFGFGQQLLLDTYLGKMILGKLHEIKTTFGKKNSQITRRLEYLIHMSKFTQEIEIYAQFFGKISVNLGLTTCEKMDFLHKFHLHCKHSWPLLCLSNVDTNIKPLGTNLNLTTNITTSQICQLTLIDAYLQVAIVVTYFAFLFAVFEMDIIFPTFQSNC